MRSTLVLLLGLLLSGSAMATDWWASEVVSSDRLGNSPYDDPLATLGKPSTWMNNSGSPDDPDPCAIMMVCPAWNVGWPNGEKLITTIKAKTSTLPAGHITVKFATPVYDDRLNWYGKDFIVFGNSSFVSGGSYVYSGSNMEEVVISSYGGGGWWEPMPVSVSQDGMNWYSYADGPYADDYAPTHAFAWDWVENRWLKDSAGAEVELDFARPVWPMLGIADFDGKSAAQGMDMYRGSGGGTACDLSELPLPIDPITGLKWIQYVRVDGAMGEVDAFSRVSHQIAEMSIGEAKKLPNGSKVVLRECVVSAAAYEVGRWCYVEHSERSGGIKVMGRVLERDKHYIIYGDMDTIADERVILATSAIPVLDKQGQIVATPVCALGMPNRSIGGGNFFTQPGQSVGQKGVKDGTGLNNIGMLVRTWGKVKSVDQTAKSFVIDDGSGRLIKCIAPRDTQADEPNNGSVPDPSFTPPAQDSFVIVTGISSCESNGQDELVSVLRLRNALDLQ